MATETKYECEDCGEVFTQNQLSSIEKASQRIAPGEPMPAGQCPQCGSLCHEQEAERQPPAEPITVFADRELGTVLHGLRIIQELRDGIKGGCLHAAQTDDADASCCDHFPEGRPLSNEEIDALCDRLSLAPLTSEPANVGAADANPPSPDQYAVRRERIDDHLDPNSTARQENEWQPPQQPGRYLAVEMSDDEPVWAMDAETLPELAKEIDESETSRTKVVVYDLDSADIDDATIDVQQSVIAFHIAVTGERIKIG